MKKIVSNLWYSMLSKLKLRKITQINVIQFFLTLPSINIEFKTTIANKYQSKSMVFLK